MSELISFLRMSPAMGVKPGAVDREKKIIRGVAVNTLGEWLGHDMYGDDEFIDSVVTMGNKLPNGMKSRFTHPGLCADGMGKHLGRVKDLRRDGDVVRGDLHLSDAADNSPDGKLASYVMDLAEEDPQAFGASIVLSRDKGKEKEFLGKNSGTDGKFKTPDSRNAKNLPHARLAALKACDVVDDPASNPGGFLSAGSELATIGEQALEYLTGARETVPAESFGGLEPERVKTFFQSYLQRHCLTLQPITKEAPVADEKPAPKQGASVAELRKAFPKHPDFVLSQLEAGNTLADAQSAFKDVLLAERDAEIAALKAVPAPVAPAPAPAFPPVKPIGAPPIALGNPDNANPVASDMPATFSLAVADHREKYKLDHDGKDCGYLAAAQVVKKKWPKLYGSDRPKA